MRQFDKNNAKYVSKRESIKDKEDQDYLKMERYAIKNENELSILIIDTKPKNELTNEQVKKLFDENIYKPKKKRKQKDKSNLNQYSFFN